MTDDLHIAEQRLSLLHSIANLLSTVDDLTGVLTRVMQMITDGSSLRRATITLVDVDTMELCIEAAHGLSSVEKGKGRYKVGEGVTGRVVQSGRAVVVPNVAESGEFLNRTGARNGEDLGEVSFLCVPLGVAHGVVGALSVDRSMAAKQQLDADLRFLEIVAAMISQAVALQQEMVATTRRIQERQGRTNSANRNTPTGMVGRAKAMSRVYELIEQVAPANTTVLITGESGTGKELVAAAIHAQSARANKAFIRVNCGALPEGVIDSELFGHERGAFTGATSMRKGRFELADGGTIFLDEIGELTPAAQVRLLRVLQERELERVGGTQTLRVDVRVVAATSRNLEELMGSNRYRPDLFYRLNVFPIHMPALRERASDITLLADHFVDKYNQIHGRAVRRIATSAIDALVGYHWPGNVRELENCIERAVLVSTDGVIHGRHLPPSLQTGVASDTQFRGRLEDEVHEYERTLLLDTLKTTRGNMAAAARLLGMTERVIRLRVRRYDIDTRRFKLNSSQI